VTAFIQCSAPGRAGIIGNPTDMYGGSVISCSIAERATVTVRPSEALTLDAGSEQRTIRTGEDLDLRGDHFDIARAVLAGSDSTEIRAHIAWRTDIPFRAGLSGSTALVVATLSAVLAYRNIRHTPYHLAEFARMIEYQHLKVFCGYQDAYMCTFGGLNYMDFRGKEFHQAFGTDPYATMEPLGSYLPALPLVIVITGSQRISGTVHKPIRQRWVEGDSEVVEAYRAVGQLARAGKKALLLGRLDELGRLMNENHAISQALGGSSPEDDRYILLAREHGALGAKLAGSGGAIIALHPQPDGMMAAARAAGAPRILFPAPMPGLTTEHGNAA
jgi:galactokinase/mevalonate kinase-like predicted kinase